MRSRRQNQLEFNGTSLAVQWLRLHASTAGGMGSIPGLGTKIPFRSGWMKTGGEPQKLKETGQEAKEGRAARHLPDFQMRDPGLFWEGCFRRARCWW